MNWLQRFFSIGLMLQAIQYVSAQSVLYDWPPVSPDFTNLSGFNRSLAISTPSFTPKSPEEILEIVTHLNPASDYPDADAIQLFSNDRTGFDIDGYYHLIQEEAVMVLNRSGAEHYSMIRLNYDLPYDRTRILEALVIHPDRTVEKITPSDIHDVSNSEDMDVNIFEPIWRSLMISYPGIRPGSILYWVYENVCIRPRTESAFQWGHSFQSTIPVLTASLHLSGPESVPIHWAVANDTAGRVKFRQYEPQAGKILYEWCSGPADMIHPEPQMVPLQELITTVHVSTDTWRSYSARESKYIEPNLVPDDAIRDKVAELTIGLDDPETKMTALFLYVARKIRYMGVSFGERPGVNPDPVTRTFANNAGVCKDKAGLLTAMLRLAGIEAWYTLNNPEVRVFSEIAVDQFNHAIVSARLPGESTWRYLDVTVDLARSMMPSSSGGTNVLRITPDGADLETIPVPPAEANSAWITAETRLDPDGRITSSVSFSGTGAADHYLREYFYYWDRNQWGSLVHYMVADRSPSAEITRWKITPDSVDNLSEPVKLDFDYSISDYAVVAGEYLLFRQPCSQSPFDWFFHRLKSISGISKRRYTVNLDVPARSHYRETTLLPNGYRLAAVPDPVRIDSEWLTFNQTWTLEQQRLVLDQEFIVHRERVGVDEYPEFHRVFSRIRTATQSYIIMEKAL